MERNEFQPVFTSKLNSILYLIVIDAVDVDVFFFLASHFQQCFKK